MAKYTVTHRCGHNHEYQLFGPNSERDRKLDWLQDQQCPTCRKITDEKRRAEVNAKAAADNLAMGCVPLTGTEAQVGYAEAIRNEVLAVFARLLDGRAGQVLPIAQFVETTTRWLMDQTSAAWWIENYKQVRGESG